MGTIARRVQLLIRSHLTVERVKWGSRAAAFGAWVPAVPNALADMPAGVVDSLRARRGDFSAEALYDLIPTGVRMKTESVVEFLGNRDLSHIESVKNAPPTHGPLQTGSGGREERCPGSRCPANRQPGRWGRFVWRRNTRCPKRDDHRRSNHAHGGRVSATTRRERPSSSRARNADPCVMMTRPSVPQLPRSRQRLLRIVLLHTGRAEVDRIAVYLAVVLDPSATASRTVGVRHPLFQGWHGGQCNQGEDSETESKKRPPSKTPTLL